MMLFTILLKVDFLGECRPVEFDKCQCRHVDFKGQGPHVVCRNMGGSRFYGHCTVYTSDKKCQGATLHKEAMERVFKESTSLKDGLLMEMDSRKRDST